MDFDPVKRTVMLALACALSACGGDTDDEESGSSGSGSSRAESIYEGETRETVLTDINRDVFLRGLFGEQGLGSLNEVLGFESILETLRSRIVSAGSTDFSEEAACFPGTYTATATSNANFSFFDIEVLYSNCEQNGITLNGRLRTSISYNSSVANAGEKTSESLQYLGLDVSSGPSRVTLDGEEELDINLTDNTSEIVRDVTISQQDNNDSQNYYQGVTLTLGENTFFPASLATLSGTYFDSEQGYVSITVTSSERYDGQAIIVSGDGGSRLLLDYEDQTDEIIIELDRDGDGVADSTQSLSRNAFNELVNP